VVAQCTCCAAGTRASPAYRPHVPRFGGSRRVHRRTCATRRSGPGRVRPAFHTASHRRTGVSSNRSRNQRTAAPSSRNAAMEGCTAGGVRRGASARPHGGSEAVRAISSRRRPSCAEPPSEPPAPPA
jgi:hypothetical protein